MSLRRAWEPTCDEPLERSLQISLRITFWDNSGERSCLESVFSTQSSRLGRLSLFHWSNNLSKSEKFLWPGWFSPRRNLLWHLQVHARLMCKGAGCARGVWVWAPCSICILILWTSPLQNAASLSLPSCLSSVVKQQQNFSTHFSVCLQGRDPCLNLCFLGEEEVWTFRLEHSLRV